LCSAFSCSLATSVASSISANTSYLTQLQHVVAPGHGLVNFTQQCRCVMATSNGDAHDPRNSTLSYSKPVAHSCSFCQVQEIDSGMIDVSDNGSYMYITVRYRATRVTEGAANKCAFFANCLRSLLPTVRSIRSRQVNNTGIALQKNWVYELQFFTHRRGEPKNLHDGTGRWSCVGEVIPEGIIPPESQRYIPIALKSKYVLSTCRQLNTALS
jgi:hypothetical protein